MPNSEHQSSIVGCIMPFLGYGRTVQTEGEKPPGQQPAHGASSSFRSSNNNNYTHQDYNTSNNTSGEDNCYYEYNHATGRHLLTRGGSSGAIHNGPPKYSWTCCLCNTIDVLIFCGCIAFLYFSIRFAFYCLENYGSDGGN